MSKFKLEDLNHILAQSYHFNWLVEDFIEKNSVCMLFGEPSTYKSFLAMDLAFCIGAGIDWYGHPVNQGQVLYLAGEGFSGIQKRFKALEKKYGCSQQGIFISSKPAALIDPDSIDEVIEAIDKALVKPELIVIDTLHRNFGEGDENSSRDFGILMKNIDALKAHTNAAILFIHHSGHGNKSHGRGSSSIRASLDCEYQLKKKGQGVELVCHKMKEFKKPENQVFELEEITVSLPTGLSDAAYIKLGNISSIASKPSRADIVLHALEEAIEASGKPVPRSILANRPDFSSKLCITAKEWRFQAYTALSSELTKQSSRQQTFNRCRADLINKSKVYEGDGKVLIL